MYYQCIQAVYKAERQGKIHWELSGTLTSFFSIYIRCLSTLEGELIIAT